MMTIAALIKDGTEKLIAAGIDEPEVNCELILAFVLNKTRTYVRAFSQDSINEKQQTLFKNILEEKLKGKPLAHIIGQAEFMGRVFKVSPNVLIPRPETEELINESLKQFKNNLPNSILDLCTGSGCIAISLAFLFKEAKITALDISDLALETALTNAQNLQIDKKINFIKSNLFENIKTKFDFIISNPPYIPTEEIKTLSPEVLCEPLLALDGGADGLDIIKKIAEQAPRYLNSKGLLALEIGCEQASKVVKFFREDIWQNPQVIKDFAGIERFIFVRKK